ncbi:MAG: hypothetical protein Q8P24_10025 [Desulfobacterales bacterium]|nr:hypothetical protein [Desulfobacterales bacterium]
MKGILLIFIGLLLPCLTTAADVATRDITGSVQNKSAPGQGINGLKITLHRYIDPKTAVVGSSLSDQHGSFSFPDISIDKQTVYYLTTTYKGTEYYSRFIDVQEKNAPPPELIVYETTDRDDDVHISVHHIFLELKDDLFQIREAMIVENKGNRVYIGSREIEPGRRETLKISLPKGAADLQHQQLMSPVFLKSGEGFVDTSSIKPGKKRIIFSYSVRPEGSRHDFIKNFYLQTDKIQFIFPGDQITAESDRLQLKGPSVNAGQQLSYLSGEAFQKGSRLVVRLHQTKTRHLFIWTISVLMLLLIATGMVLALKKKKYRPATAAVPREKLPAPPADVIDQRSAILEEIARLDDRYKCNDISTDFYNSARGRLLDKAKELTRQLHAGTLPEN